MSNKKQIEHLIAINYMGLAERIKKFKKPIKRRRAVTTANRIK